MNMKIFLQNKADARAKVFIVNSIQEIEKISLTGAEKAYVLQRFDSFPGNVAVVNRLGSILFICLNDTKASLSEQKEACRKKGACIAKLLNENKFETVFVDNVIDHSACILALTEGLALASYQFLKYKTSKECHTLGAVYLSEGSASWEALSRLRAVVDAVCWSRDLVNEPVNYLNAVGLSGAISEKVQEAGGKAEVLDRRQIEELGMGGLLAVNAGSVDPPTFTILEWKPEKARNEKPVVLVGKGIVYDSGGYNLKTGVFMATMKHDMAGAATVAATVVAAANAKLPVHLVALIPATDNRLHGNAHVPDDVITMFDGTTVEIVNTDAEGRLVLADALTYAKRYDPLVVFDFATLTGAAKRAIGSQASVVMGKDADSVYAEIERCGFETHERVVRFPLWEEYGKLIKSDIADLRNSGGAEAGAITAGKFLEHFVEYPWLHFDIAGTAFSEKGFEYCPPGGTGVGVRLLMRYFSGF